MAQETALLVGLKLTGRDRRRPGSGLITAEDSLEELAALASTAGARVAERFVQTRSRPDAATVLLWPFADFCFAARRRCRIIVSISFKIGFSS